MSMAEFFNATLKVSCKHVHYIPTCRKLGYNNNQCKSRAHVLVSYGCRSPAILQSIVGQR